MVKPAHEFLTDNQPLKLVLYPENQSAAQTDKEPVDETNLFLFEEFLMPKKSRSDTYHPRHEPNKDTDLLIDTINSMDLGWKANKCMLQESHPEYPGAACHT